MKKKKKRAQNPIEAGRTIVQWKGSTSVAASSTRYNLLKSSKGRSRATINACTCGIVAILAIRRSSSLTQDPSSHRACYCPSSIATRPIHYPARQLDINVLPRSFRSTRLKSIDGFSSATSKLDRSLVSRVERKCHFDHCVHSDSTGSDARFLSLSLSLCLYREGRTAAARRWEANSRVQIYTRVYIRSCRVVVVHGEFDVLVGRARDQPPAARTAASGEMVRGGVARTAR